MYTYLHKHNPNIQHCKTTCHTRTHLKANHIHLPTELAKLLPSERSHLFMDFCTAYIFIHYIYIYNNIYNTL